MKLLVDEMPSHPDECVFSTDYWDYDEGSLVYDCMLSRTRCNCSECKFLEGKKNDHQE